MGLTVSFCEIEIALLRVGYMSGWEDNSVSDNDTK